MKIIAYMLTVSALLAGSTCLAQNRDPASPKVGNKERGRELLAVLGPRPNNAAGITPLQQQELSRRVRCAATRQEIQDELDFEAAGSKGFYPLLELRAAENEICTPPPQLILPSLPLAPSRSSPKVPPPPPPPQATLQPQAQRNVAHSSNYPSLDAAALDVARIWRIPAAAGRTIKVPLTFSAH